MKLYSFLYVIFTSIYFSACNSQITHTHDNSEEIHAFQAENRARQSESNEELLNSVIFVGVGVNRQGPVKIPINEKLYLLKAIEYAGGFVHEWPSYVVTIKRKNIDGLLVEVARVNTKMINPLDFELKAGDIIVTNSF